uniref:Uncharacterized protein n=1 Tax=viral metagenome TaxID=1070528 RepID=A0A6M3LU14_9ZZZZ
MEIIIKNKTRIPTPSRDEIKSMEKKGYVYAYPREIESEAAKTRRHNDKMLDESIKKGIKEGLDKIEYGYKPSEDLKKSGIISEVK